LDAVFRSAGYFSAIGSTKRLEANKVFYQKEIEKSRKELSDLQSNPAAIEKFAREHFLMKKEGEDIFILDDSAAIKNN